MRRIVFIVLCAVVPALYWIGVVVTGNLPPLR